MTISSLVAPSPLGPLSLFAEDGAIIALDWGKGAQLEGPDMDLLQDASNQLKAYFSQERHSFDLALRPHGTDFQKKVWKAMCDIPYGTTKSYGEIAELVSSAPRAVGQACGANPIPILIPCHRILRQGGVKLGGYSGHGGLETKAKLLRLEGALPQSA